MSSTESTIEATGCISSQKKRQLRAVYLGEKKIIINMYKSEAEASSNFLNLTNSDVIKKTAYNTGTSEGQCTKLYNNTKPIELFIFQRKLTYLKVFL